MLSIERLETEKIRYLSPFQEYQAQTVEQTVFNGPLIQLGDKWYIFPREQMAKQIPGIPDAPSSIGIYEVDPNTLKTTHIQSIAVSEIIGDNKSFSPEDLRGIAIDEDTILFGLTAARGGDPYPAILCAKLKNGQFEFGKMKVLELLGPAKNTMPLNEDTLLIRPEIALSSMPQRFQFVKRDPITDIWSMAGETTLPEIKWLNGNGKYGVTGWSDRFQVPGRPGIERIIIHANRCMNGITEYALLLAEFQLREDGTFFFLGVDKKPLITAREAKKLLFEKTGRKINEPDPKKIVVYFLGGLRGVARQCDEHITPLTISDHEIHYYSFPRTILFREFSINN